MIRLEPAPVPTAFEVAASRAFEELEETARAGGYKSQRRFDFDAAVWLKHRDEIGAASSGKCAYCEIRFGKAEAADVDHFRPRSRAEGLQKGEIDPDHYWWLAYEWSNLVPSCPSCSRAKRNRFPVRGRRARPRATVEREEPLLLSPYGPEDPQEHLWYDDQGHIRPFTEEGEITIQVLNLDRPDLVQRRRDHAAGVLATLELADFVIDADTWEFLSSPETEFAALTRQLLEERATQQDDETVAPPAAAPEDGRPRARGLPTFEAEPTRKEPARKEPPRKAPPARSTTPSDLSSVWIEEIDLVDFGCIQELELRFGEPQSGREPWIVLLGANGVGKSTILKAIALALSSRSDRRRLAPLPERYLRRGAKRGHVRVAFNDGSEVRLEIERGSEHFDGEGHKPAFDLVGYGSTRLLRRNPTAAMTRATGPRLTNLFDPWAPLADAELWLADTDRVDADDFRVLASQLKTLLSVGADVELRRRSGSLRARLFDEMLDLDQLSDGYQTILALALDLSLAFGNELGQGYSTENFEGMVLLDELEVHLHPEWKLRVVGDLREMFPHLQFVVTTHDPLCLRGLEQGEIHLLERDDDGVITIQQIDVPPGLDADEILTGQWFGLDTTLDPEVEADFLEYQRLRMQGHGPGDPALADLHGRLERTLGTYAGSSLSGVMVEAATEIVSQQIPEGTDELSPAELKERLMAHVRRAQP